MEFYNLRIGNIERKLPIVPLGPKLKIASFNILGDKELVEVAAEKLCRKLTNYDFDYLVGPEITVLPLIHEMAGILGHKRYIILRKQIHGYMIKPIQSEIKPGLVISGPDAEVLKGGRVIVVDDVVSTGRTVKVILDLLSNLGAKIVAKVAILKQGDKFDEEIEDLIYLQKIPLLT